MKIEKETNNKLIITITEEEFKEAFRSPEQLTKFRENLLNLIGTYHQCCAELRGNNDGKK